MHSASLFSYLTPVELRSNLYEAVRESNTAE
jgi:hypothetical protein